MEAIVEELDPRRRGPCPEGIEVVVDFEQITARRAAVDNLEKTELPRAAIDALKPRVVAHRQKASAICAEQSKW